MTDLITLGERARAAAKVLALAPAAQKNAALTAIADALLAQREYILQENQKDIDAAVQNGMSQSLLDRLTLTAARIDAMAEGLLQVVALPDPVGVITEKIERPNGLSIHKTTVPLGVIGIIFESRPGVTVDAAALCLKAGNAVLLRGGKEAIGSNMALAAVMRAAIAKSGLPEDSVALVSDTSRETAAAMMRLNGYIDVLIPRGGASLIRAVCETATVPVIETGTGNCHLFVDSPCDEDMALRIIENAKCQRPSVCNAVETLLIHRAAAPRLLPRMQAALAPYGVELRACPESRALLPGAKSAREEDYATEFNDYILAVRIVGDLDEALKHIARYGTRHSECIVTENPQNAARFMREVDAAAVYHNASTRFTDGFEFGMGAEIGISTQKMHARGPMGLRELTSSKFVIYGNGQIR